MLKKNMNRSLWGIMLCLLLCNIFSTISYASEKIHGECVILLHGLARTSGSMEKIETRLIEEGYSVANIDYPSREFAIEKLADIAVTQGLDVCRKMNAESIHFVTHSLGGILVRQYLAEHKIQELGRVVMLTPPNQGSNVVDKFSGLPGYELLYGPAGYQLGKDDRSIPLQLGPANFEVGIIAGNRTVNFILSTAFDEPNDGKVAVEDTKLRGMKDFIVVHHSHPFIMKSDEVIDLIVHFLRYGYFVSEKKRGIRQ